MQFKKVNVNELPQDDVLAYSYGGHKLIGKLKNMADIVVCVTRDTSLSNISHYIELDEIKPSEPKLSLLEALPNDWIICKSDNRLEVYRSFRDTEDGLIYDEQRRPESIKDFEERIIDDLL